MASMLGSSGVAMVKYLQSCICPLPVHHQEADLIVVVLPGINTSYLCPWQRRQNMLVPKVSLDCERASQGIIRLLQQYFKGFMNRFFKGWLKVGSRFQGKHEVQNKSKKYHTDLSKGSHIDRSDKISKNKRGNMEVFNLLTLYGFLISK